MCACVSVSECVHVRVRVHVRVHVCVCTCVCGHTPCISTHAYCTSKHTCITLHRQDYYYCKTAKTITIARLQRLQMYTNTSIGCILFWTLTLLSHIKLLFKRYFVWQMTSPKGMSVHLGRQCPVLHTNCINMFVAVATSQ